MTSMVMHYNNIILTGSGSLSGWGTPSQSSLATPSSFRTLFWSALSGKMTVFKNRGIWKVTFRQPSSILHKCSVYFVTWSSFVTWVWKSSIAFTVYSLIIVSESTFITRSTKCEDFSDPDENGHSKTLRLQYSVKSSLYFSNFALSSLVPNSSTIYSIISWL